MATMHYMCENGHELWATRPIEPICPVYVRGRPCAGPLKRVGPGSRGPRKKSSNKLLTDPPIGANDAPNTPQRKDTP